MSSACKLQTIKQTKKEKKCCVVICMCTHGDIESCTTSVLLLAITCESAPPASVQPLLPRKRLGRTELAAGFGLWSASVQRSGRAPVPASKNVVFWRPPALNNAPDSTAAAGSGGA